MTGCVQSRAESPQRDVQSVDGIFPILAYGPPEFAQPYSAANRGRTNKRAVVVETSAAPALVMEFPLQVAVGPGPTPVFLSFLPDQLLPFGAL